MSEQSKAREAFLSGEAGIYIFLPSQLLSLQLPCCVTEALGLLMALSNKQGISMESNRYLARILHCSINSVDRRLAYLKKLNLINTDSFDGRKRILRLNWLEINKRRYAKTGKKGKQST